MEYELDCAVGFTIVGGVITTLLEKGDYGILDHGVVRSELSVTTEYQIWVGTGTEAYPRLEDWIIGHPVRIIGWVIAKTNGDMVLKIEHIEPVSTRLRSLKKLPLWWKGPAPSHSYREIKLK